MPIPLFQLKEGQTFRTMNEAVNAAIQWNAERKYSFKAHTSNKKVKFYICKHRSTEKKSSDTISDNNERSISCPFQIRISQNPRGEYEIRNIVDHNCNTASHRGWKLAHSIRFVKAHHESTLSADRKRRPKDLRTDEVVHHGNTISRQQASKIKKTILQELDGDEAESFEYLHTLRVVMCQGDPENNVPEIEEIRRDIQRRYIVGHPGGASTFFFRNASNRFSHFYVQPHAAKRAWDMADLQQFFSIDGAHLTSAYGQHLYTASTLDPNLNILVLAFGIGPTEGKDHWTAFLRFLKTSLSLTDESVTRIISDRGTGLLPGVENAFSSLVHFYCAQHLAENVKSIYGPEAEKVFRSLPEEPLENRFREKLDILRQTNAAAADYIEAIKPERYALWAIQYPRLGQTCSNISESLNSAWLQCRDRPILHCILEIWEYLMGKWHEHSTAKFRNPRWCDRPYDWYLNQSVESRFYFCTGSNISRHIATVKTNRGGEAHIVNLTRKTCTCREFQDRMIPCRHAIRACDEFGLDPESYISNFYSVENYRRIYDGEQSFLWPIIKEFLSKSKGSCLPPLAQKQKGTRVKKRRERRKAIEREKVEKERERQQEIRETGGSHGPIFIRHRQEIAPAILSQSSQASSQRLSSPRPVSSQSPTSTPQTQEILDNVLDELPDLPSRSPCITSGDFSFSPLMPSQDHGSPYHYGFSRPVYRQDVKEFPAGYIKTFRPLSMIIPPPQRPSYRRKKHISLYTLIPRLRVSGDSTQPVFQPSSKAPNPDIEDNESNSILCLIDKGKDKAATQSSEIESTPLIVTTKGVDFGSFNKEDIKKLLNDPEAALKMLEKDDNPPKGLIQYLKSKTEQQNRQRQGLVQLPLPSKKLTQPSLLSQQQSSRSTSPSREGSIQVHFLTSHDPFKDPPNSLNSPQSTQSPRKRKAIDISPRKQPNRNVGSNYMRCAVCSSKNHRDYHCPHPHCKFCLVVDHKTANCPEMENIIQIESDRSSEQSE